MPNYKKLRRDNRRIQKCNIILELRNTIFCTNYQLKNYKKMCFCCFREARSHDMSKQHSRKKTTKEIKQDRDANRIKKLEFLV